MTCEVRFGWLKIWVVLLCEQRQFLADILGIFCFVSCLFLLWWQGGVSDLTFFWVNFAISWAQQPLMPAA